MPKNLVAATAEKKRVLILDRYAEIANTLAMLLEESGYETATANDAKFALEVAEQFLPHVVCTNLRLFGMSGIEFAKEIRARYGSSVRLIALTGSTLSFTIAEVTAAGFDVILLKPTDFDVLLATISGLLLEAEFSK